MTVGRDALREVVLLAAAVCGALAVGGLALVQVAADAAHTGEGRPCCLLAPFAVLDSAAHLGAVAAAALVAFVLTTTAGVLLRHWVAARAMRHGVSRARLGSLPLPLAQAAAAAGLAGSVDVVEARRAFAFVYGWRRPRVCVSTGLVEALSDRELLAALLHERWHRDRRDPVRMAAAAALGAGLCFVPKFRARVEQYVVAVEVAADSFVVAQMGDARGLAGALLRLEPGAIAPGFGGRMEPRAAALLEGTVRRDRSREGWAAVVLTLEAAVAALVVFGSRPAMPVCNALMHVC